jgi:hypothetical protein
MEHTKYTSRFVADPDPETLSTLAATASTRQALDLIHFMADYLVKKASIAVNIPVSYLLPHALTTITDPMQSQGPSSYALTFHVPFLVYRNTRNFDRRVCCRESAKPLREAESMSYMRWDAAPNEGAPKSDLSNGDDYGFLYEAQFSAMICGRDSERWIAYGLFDTYYEDPDLRETARFWVRDSEDGHTGDPLTLLHDDPGRVNICPREKFLRVLETRLSRIKDEWHKVVEVVVQRIEAGVST